jgi:hypothetical protein
MPLLTEEEILVAEKTSARRQNVFDKLNQSLNAGMGVDQAILSVAASEVAAALRPLLDLFFAQLSSLSPENSPLSKRDVEYLREKYAFVSLLPGLVAKNFKQYVAVHDGQVVDADRSRRDLVRRFFQRYGNDAPVYIGYVGQPSPGARVPTPFFRRSSQ